MTGHHERTRRDYRFWRRTPTADVADEVAFHLQSATDEGRAAGLSPDAARAAALQRFGDVAQVRRTLDALSTRGARDEHRREWFSALLQDLRFGVRQLRRSPGFTCIAIATLSLAIGATTSVMSLVRGVLLRPLPFASQGQLVHLEPRDRDGGIDDISPLDFIDLGTQTSSFTGLAAMSSSRTATLVRTGSDPVRLDQARVSANFFAVLGVRPQLGRLFVPGDDKPGAPSLVVLSDATWRTVFGSDPRVVGKPVMIDGSAHTVIGVAPRALRYPASTDSWVPLVWKDYEIDPSNRGLRELEVVGRRKPRATLAQVQADLGQFIARKRIPATDPDAGYRIGAVPLADTIVGSVRAPLLAMLGAVAFVLLIACANIANLLLARAVARQSEIGVRLALGAGRGRLIRQLLTESLLLAVCAAAIGSMLAWAAVHAMARFGPPNVPRLDEITVDGTVLLVTALLAIMTGVVFGLVPALHALNPQVAGRLRSGHRTSGSRETRRLRSGLVVAEIALAVVLLTGAGLLLRSLERLLAVDPGFRPQRVIAFDARISPQRYPWDIDVINFAAAVATQLYRLPQVQSLSIAASRPLDPQRAFDLTTSFTITGRPEVPGSAIQQAAILPVGPEYFSTLGIPLITGRVFTTAEDRTDAPQVVVVSEAFARKFFPQGDALGHDIVFGMSHHISSSPADSFRSRGTIVGVVRDVRMEGMAEASPPAVYLAYNTLPGSVSFVIRTTMPLAALTPQIRTAVRAVDPEVAVYSLTTMDDAISTSVIQPRFYAEVLAGFAALALLIAALGTYGVLAYLIRQRGRELGIRIALGASRGRIARAVVGNAMVLAGSGVVIGVLGAAVLTRGLASVLYQTGPLDPVALAGAALTLLGTAAVAAWLPARRAASTDPTAVMRAE